MLFPVFPFLVAVLATLPINILAGSSSNPAPTCVTITNTIGSSCPVPTVSCSGVPFCPIAIVTETVTLECGCPSIYHTTICATTCNTACPMDYDTVYIPCATSISLSSSSSSPTVTTTITTTVSSSSSSSSSKSLSSTGSSSVSSTGSSRSPTANHAALATRMSVLEFMAILPGVLLL